MQVPPLHEPTGVSMPLEHIAVPHVVLPPGRMQLSATPLHCPWHWPEPVHATRAGVLPVRGAPVT